MTRATIAATIAILVTMTAGCADAPLHVATIQVGRAVNPDGSVGSPTTLFKPNETVYVSALTDAAGAGTISVKWMYGSRVIDEPKKEVSFQGPAATEFRLENSGGFPPGDYSVEVFVDGVSVGRRNFKVDD